MGKERVATQFKNKNVKNLSVPPGYKSHSSFCLKRKGRSGETDISKDDLDFSKEDQIQIDTMFGMSEDVLKRSLRHRPWIIFDQTNHKSKESDFEHVDKDFPSETCLEKGVIRGCSNCSDCVKVAASWCPGDSRTDILEEAPVLYPTEEEFKDTLEYIAKLRPRAERYGICRIVPPPSWNPSYVIMEKKVWENSTFSTHVQRIAGSQVPYSQSKTSSFVEDMKSKRRTLRMGQDSGYGNEHVANVGESGYFDTEHLESMPLLGPKFTMETFKRYADDFKGQYFCRSKVTDSKDCSTVPQEQWEPSVENIEGEYNRIIGNPTEEIEVLCCDNLETGAFGSGFPTASNPTETSSCSETLNSGWNLNNIARLPGSLLSFESNDTARILVPQVRIGMCFSTLHWRVEEHNLYSLCYSHIGAPKIWYGIPGKYSTKFRLALKNKFSDLLGRQDKLHSRSVKELSPFGLNSEGIPVFRCIQYPGEFVLIFPGAYHSGFDCGFNCSETACFAPLDWLPHGQNAVELYRGIGKKTSLSHDKLLLQAAFEAVRAQWELALCRKKTIDNQRWKDACGNEGILAKAFKSRVKSEDIAIKYLCNSSQTRRMDKNFNASSKRECKICLYDLHFSAVGCPCSDDIYSCLNHAKQLCSCGWTEKFFLLRYDVGELNILVEALEGKLKSVYKWAKDNLGLSLNSHVTKNSLQASGQGNSPNSYADKLKEREQKFKNGATLYGTGGSVSSIRAEIKAHLLQLRQSNKSKEKSNKTESTEPNNLKEKKNKTESPNVATASGIGRIFSSSNKAYTKAHAAKSTFSNEWEAAQNVVEPAVISSTSGYSSFLQKLPSEISSASTSESSDESDG